ncbi:MAG: hypothetical protein MZU79_05760 [Anaerotruncus sp.]|nr:hypothetical protein [Anaerotruncus sp.]
MIANVILLGGLKWLASDVYTVTYFTGGDPLFARCHLLVGRRVVRARVFASSCRRSRWSSPRWRRTRSRGSRS